eukprot:scaffold2849_cov174-Amphora_coffeaeformis.AAC.25
MVRLSSNRRRRLPQTTAAPQIRMCISWRYILPALILAYTGGLILFVLSLDLGSGNTNTPNSNDYHDPLHLKTSKGNSPPDHVAQMVQEVHKEMQLLEHQIMAWTGWENNDNDMFVKEKVQLVTVQAEIKRLYDMERHLESKYPGRHVTLCRRPGKDTVLSDADTTSSHGSPSVQYTTQLMASCPEHEPNKDYYYYNPSENDRFISEAQLKIPAKGIVPVPASWEHPASLEACQHSDCINGAHLYSVLPDTTGKGVPPIWIKDNTHGGTPQPFEDCDIPCLHSGRDSIMTTREIDQTPFTFTFSMEGEAYYGQLKIDHQQWRENKFYATTAFNSEIPLPYFSFAEYDILHKYKPVNFDEAIKGALFLARNCGSRNNRENVVKGLQNSTFRLDSLSSCLHNADPPKHIPVGNGPGDKHPIMRAYLFYCSFENQNTPDYITEKLWGAFEAGVVPIYFGAPNVKDHVPEHSLVFVDDFKNVNDLAAHLHKVASNRTLYEEYHTWRNKPKAMAHFLQKYNITRTHNQCRTCRWAYAKKYGLGWSHENQQLLDTQLPRHACRDGGQGLLTWPVRERWYQRQDNDDETRAAMKAKPARCAPIHAEPWEAHTIVAGHWIRTIHEHDGVIDCRVEAKHKKDFSVDDDTLRNSAVLEMVLPFNENDPRLRYRQVTPGHYEWQNQTSRITLLVKPAENTPIRRRGKTTVQFMHPQAVRIMVEDVDRFHVGAADEPSYFGKTMKDEWYTPIEVFAVESSSGKDGNTGTAESR